MIAIANNVRIKKELLALHIFCTMYENDLEDDASTVKISFTQNQSAYVKEKLPG